MANQPATYSARIVITKEAETVKDRYDKVEAQGYQVNLTKLEISAKTLEELQTKITAHTNLVSDL